MRRLQNNFRLIGSISGTIALVVSLFVNAHAQVGNAPAPTTSATTERVLVLKDGGVLRGQISTTGDYYLIVGPSGEMQIAASNVLLVSTSLEAAYETRREMIAQAPKFESHLTLADWCLRNGLLRAAEQQLEAARQVDAHHPRLTLLDRRLAQAKTAPPVSSPSSRAVATVTPQVSTEANAAPPKALAADVSHEVVEVFTRRVQPILVNNCTTSRCHAPGGDQTFQFDRASLRGTANRRTTMRNLAAALALVDRAHPAESALLTVPRHKHGDMEAPIFGPRQEQAYKHLIEWVCLVVPPAVPQEPAQPLAVERPQLAVAGATTSPRVALTGLGAEEKAAPAEKNASVDADVQAADYLESGTLRPKSQLRYGVNLQGWTPRDPFDPEIFNRRYRKTEPPAGN